MTINIRKRPILFTVAVTLFAATIGLLLRFSVSKEVPDASRIPRDAEIEALRARLADATARLPKLEKRPERASRQDQLEKDSGWKLRKYIGNGYNLSRFSTLDPFGDLTPQVIQEADLTDAEAKKVQELFNVHREQMRSLVKKNCKLPPICRRTKREILG